MFFRFFFFGQPTGTSPHTLSTDSMGHQHQFLPLGEAVWRGIVIIEPHVGQADASFLKLQVVYHQAAILRMHYLQARQRAVYEYERLAIPARRVSSHWPQCRSGNRSSCACWWDMDKGRTYPIHSGRT